MPTVTPYATNIINPQDIAFDASGNLYVAAAGKNAVLKIPSASGGTVGGTPSVVGSGQEPTGVAVDASGNVFWVYADKTTLYKNNQPFVSHESLKSPQAIAIDASGNIYVSCAGNNRVVRITAS